MSKKLLLPQGLHHLQPPHVAAIIKYLIYIQNGLLENTVTTTVQMAVIDTKELTNELTTMSCNSYSSWRTYMENHDTLK